MTNFHVILTPSERDDVVTAIDLAFRFLSGDESAPEVLETLQDSLTAGQILAFDTLATKIATVK